jgi:penicillin-binding protein 1C
MLKKVCGKIKALKPKTRSWLTVVALMVLCFAFALPKNLFNKPTSYVIEDPEGNLLSASIAADGQWRFPK